MENWAEHIIFHGAMFFLILTKCDRAFRTVCAYELNSNKHKMSQPSLFFFHG